MAPDVKAEKNVGAKSKHSAAAESAAEAALKARLSRKRTKTGCLTCRKRRIKCGEEHPVCKNCVKSKRHCEGYNQRVVFKPPTFDYRPAPHGGAHIIFQAGPAPGPAAPSHGAEVPQYAVDAVVYSQLRPRPAEQYAPAVHQPRQGSDSTQQQQHPQNLATQYMLQPAPFAPMQQRQGQSYAQGTLSVSAGASYPTSNAQSVQHVQYLDHGQRHSQVSGDMYSAMSSQITPPVQPVDAYAQAWNHAQHPQSASQQNGWPISDMPAYNNYHNSSQVDVKPGKTFLITRTPVAQPSSQTWTTESYVPRPELCRPIDYQPPHILTTHLQRQPQVTTVPRLYSGNEVTPEFYEYEPHPPLDATPTQQLIEAAVETQDDDYYDVQSDEEMDLDTSMALSNDYERQRTLSNILAINQITSQDLQMRRYDTFLFDGMLDHYRVEQVANPLRNAATARVFAHFISATGPSLSIFERHPRNTSVLTDGFVPFAQQGLWTYTMPMAALHHQGLLHAMLALASLHIARLQNASMSPSMKHYGWALKRIHRCVSNRKRRLQVTTIAASMLLGFYEIIVADHMKWNTHLAGAKQLFEETDFVGMTRQFRRMKMDKAARDQLGRRRHSYSEQASYQDDVLDQIPDVDERILSRFVGKEVRYGDHGRIETPHSGIPEELDLNKFEILKDLYWWYCKQDTYQSIVSGNPLLMDYSRWSNCPPRAPLGRADAVYGSFDHLILLLARIADFAAKDRTRKLRQMELTGGQWVPAAGMNIPRPPQAGPPSTPVSATGRQAPPPGPRPGDGPTFFGMAPPPSNNIRMPASYNPIYTPPTPQSARPHEPIDLQVDTQNALEEYGRIRAALREFAEYLGPDFQPLDSEYQEEVETPFGKALFYRSYDIGCLWAVYNMAEIIAIRSHPHMHPAAHAAAAITAQETKHYAEQIGRIAAGIVPGPASRPLNPTLGAALCESCMPSFFAAVQYQNAEQRHATVMRIYGIALRTGFGSAELIANGCETSWVKAGQAGRGPPYQRVVRPQHSDDPRLNGSWERLDPNAMPDEQDEGDRRLVHMKANARLNWAVGVMGTEHDVGKTNGTT